ncbi:MAG: hypothetical protein WBI05_05085, partial [Rhodoferax sp.]
MISWRQSTSLREWSDPQKPHQCRRCFALLCYSTARGFAPSSLSDLNPTKKTRHFATDTLASFRRRFIDELAGLFVQVLEMAREMRLLKLGTVCLDGTK